MNKKENLILKSYICLLKLIPLIVIPLLLFALLVFKPMRNVSYHKGSNNMLGNLGHNLNLTDRNDSSYDASYSFKVSTADIFNYILKYSNNIEVENARELAELIRKECKRYNLNPYLVLAIIKVESSFDPLAISHKGAIGLMQMMPETGKHLASKKGLKMDDEALLSDPMVNVELGIYYFYNLLRRYNDLESALYAYNYGPGRFELISSSKRGVPAYVSKVIKFKDFLERKSLRTKQS